MKEIITKAYDPENFRKEGHALVDFLANYLQEMQGQQADASKTINWTTPADSLKIWERDAQKNIGDNWMDFFKDIFDHSVRLHHPKYMGHQISAPTPITALSGFLSDFLNNGMGVYEMGVASSTLESVIAKRMAQAIGFGEEADGFLTSGGTLGNLTALLCARSVKASDPVWTKGTHKQLALMVSDQAHYCVDKAVRIMGWGEEGVIKIPTNERFQMKTELLEAYLEEAKAAGKEVIAVVGSACSTSTGSFDDLQAIGAFCQKHKLWFHIDGAHGGGIVFSEKYKSLLAGIELADSVIMDFHKTLLTPAITTSLIFKKGVNSYKTFAQKAQYLWNRDGDQEWFNYAKRTFECTKLMMSIKVYATLKAYGTELWDEYVTSVIDLSRAFGERLNNEAAFELAVEPECNIVCFRWKPGNQLNDNDLNQINDAIRQELLEVGEFYIVKTVINGKLWLRTTLTNPFTEMVHLEELIKRIKTVGNEIYQAFSTESIAL